MTKSSAQLPKVNDGNLKLPVSAAEAFATRQKTKSTEYRKHDLSRIAGFFEKCTFKSCTRS